MSPARDGREEELGGGLIPVQSLLQHNNLQYSGQDKKNYLALGRLYFGPGVPWLHTVRIRPGHHPDILPVWPRVFTNVYLDI